MNSQKVARENLGPEQMLNNLRNETRKNRELCNDVIGRELNDKKERLQSGSATSGLNLQHG